MPLTLISQNTSLKYLCEYYYQKLPPSKCSTHAGNPFGQSAARPLRPHVRPPRLPTTCPFRWQSQYVDAETNLYYNRFRSLDSQTGQYISSDPISIEVRLNTHSYVRNYNNSVDILGLSGCSTTKLDKKANKP